MQQLFAILPAPYRSPVARYSFKHVYVDASEAGLYKAKELVSFSGRDFMATATREREGDAMDGALERRGRRVEEETLDEYGFLKGDLLSVAVSVPEPRAVRNGAPGLEVGRDARAPPRDAPRSELYRSRPPPARGGWRDRSPGPPGPGRRDSNDRWGRRSRSRSPDRRRDSWARGRD